MEECAIVAYLTTPLIVIRSTSLLWHNVHTAKHGCIPVQCMNLIQYILEDCGHLDFRGFMTIGRLGHCYKEDGPNPDFLVRLTSTVRNFIKVSLR